jgi:hypothetical protein
VSTIPRVKSIEIDILRAVKEIRRLRHYSVVYYVDVSDLSDSWPDDFRLVE